jgi:O-methyltransferase
MDFTIYPGSRISRLPRALQPPALLLRNVARALPHPFQIQPPPPSQYPWAADGLGTIHFCPFLEDREFNAAYERMVDHWTGGQPDTAQDVRWRVWILVSLAREVAHRGGAFAEFGVFRAGSAFMILSTCPPRSERFYLFDTFEGVPSRNLTRLERWMAGLGRDTSAEDVAGFLSPWREQICIVKGDVFETLPMTETGPLALVHMDLNAAAATAAALEYAYARLAPGGVAVFDDYGWTGYEDQRRVIDAFFAGRPERPLALPTGQAIVIKR